MLEVLEELSVLPIPTDPGVLRPAVVGLVRRDAFGVSLFEGAGGGAGGGGAKFGAAIVVEGFRVGVGRAMVGRGEGGGIERGVVGGSIEVEGRD